ncbi:MAG: helix-hairpin-helix domain-containing protein [Paludibacter sp.]|nr:helix-hairpin-helix domain-containing protein [Paludibacter sp.]
MWKDFFFFSGSQRAGIILLVFLIVISSLINFYLPRCSDDISFVADSADMSEFEDFKKSLVSLDSLREKQRFESLERKFNSFYKEKNKEEPCMLLPFDPNVLDSAGFVDLGLKPYVAANIIKYRVKGGRFRDKESFSRVYGVSEEKYRELEPYISISSNPSIADLTSTLPKEEVSVAIVELNSADTARLMQVKGIGMGYARSIIRFRQQAGGFTCVEQLREMYGMTPDNFEKIKPFCTVNLTLVNQINVNKASVDKLRAHPYLNFYQARQIYELRRKKGKLTGLDDLRGLSELNDSVLLKIKPYLKFE